jgi:nucleotide-binding universal stress UspA family protein
MTDDEVIVGYDGSARSRDALALGRRLAEVLTARVVLAYVYSPAVVGGDVGSVYTLIVRQRAEDVLREAPAPGVGDRRAVAAHSVARGLHRLADEEGAVLVAVGSSDDAAPGRTKPSGVAQRLLHGSPCAVSVAPAGYAETAPWARRRILVGYIPTDDGAAALRAGAALAGATGAVLRLVTVVAPVTPALGEADARRYLQAVKQDRRRALDEAVGTLSGRVTVEAEVLEGRPAEILRASSTDADLVVVGSRGYGPVRQVLLGSVSAKLLDDVGAPVIVLPRGADRELAAAVPAPPPRNPPIRHV